MDSSDFKNHQKEHYRDMSNREDIDKRRATRNHYRKIEAIDSFLDVEDGDKVLEVGVGTGIQAEHLLDKHKNKKFEFHGIDISQDLLKLTAEKLEENERIHLKEMDAENLEYKDHHFDKAFVGSTIHHLADPVKGILEKIRVVKPGGKIAIMEPNFIHPKNFLFAMRHYSAEKNMRFMTKKYLSKILDKLPVHYEFVNFIYMPNGPKFMVPVYNFFENIISRIPVLNWFSIMLFVKVTKLEA